MSSPLVLEEYLPNWAIAQLWHVRVHEEVDERNRCNLNTAISFAPIIHEYDETEKWLKTVQYLPPCLVLVGFCAIYKMLPVVLLTLGVSVCVC